jgi:pre-mRNA-splicing factor ATP-dependent RNA helicase DHX15/PRP43
VTRKDDLKIIIMSATIDATLFTDFFPGSVLETVSGREHKVLVSYLAEAVDSDHAISTIVDTILQVHLKERAGNILVFASGVGDIHKIISRVEMALGEGPNARFDASEMGPLTCYPLHATLSPEEQDEAVESVAPGPRNGLLGRKLIVATNIAETSITLTGVTHVIDSCRVKSKIWNPRNESWSLRELWVSKAVAKQRAGRAGRTREGMAWRMCTEADFLEQLEEHSVPAILESDMLSEYLHILKMGRSPLNFPFMVAPASETIVKAQGLLFQLGAVDARGQLTPRGEEITQLPVDVYSAVVLLSSPDYGCSDEMLSLVSMIEASEGGSHVFVNAITDEMKKQLAKIKAKYRHPTGDHLTLFNIYMAWRSACLAGTADEFVRENMLLGTVLKTADRTRKQLLSILYKHKSWKLLRMLSNKPDYYVSMLKALATGNYLRVAKRQSESQPRAYDIARTSAPVMLTASTSLGTPSDLNEWVIYNEFNISGAKREIRLVSAIAPELLIATAPAYWSDLEFLPNGHIKDKMVKVLANMTNMDESVVRGGMPKLTVAPTQ